jgi:hypothetical protein
MQFLHDDEPMMIRQPTIRLQRLSAYLPFSLSLPLPLEFFRNKAGARSIQGDLCGVRRAASERRIQGAMPLLPATAAARCTCVC